jgi:hypothetical protein
MFSAMKLNVVMPSVALLIVVAPSETPSSSGACILKLITAVIYGFHNKLECLSLATLLA